MVGMTEPMRRNTEQMIEVGIGCRHHHEPGTEFPEQRPLHGGKPVEVDMLDCLDEDRRIEAAIALAKIGHRTVHEPNFVALMADPTEPAVERLEHARRQIDADHLLDAFASDERGEERTVTTAQVENRPRALGSQHLAYCPHTLAVKVARPAHRHAPCFGSTPRPSRLRILRHGLLCPICLGRLVDQPSGGLAIHHPESSEEEIMIKVTRTADALELLEFDVAVSDGSGESRHVVTLANDLYRHLTQSRHSPERCGEAAFRFLLDREPKEAILERFDVAAIYRHFPEFEQELPR